jgi:AsmA protein
MRKLLIGAVLVLLLAVVAVAALLFVPSPVQKWAVERGASVATGREVTFGEPFRLRAWPPVAITAADVRVANADWGEEPELARVEALDARVGLLALWRENRIDVEWLVVRRPHLNLEVAEDGRRNWTFGDGAPAEPEAEEPAETKEIPGFVLGDVRIEGGAVTYDDRATKLSLRAEEIELAIAQAGADQPARIDGGLTIDGKRATLAGNVGRPDEIAAGATSPVALELQAPGGTANFDGTANTAAPAVNGRAGIDLRSQRELLAWLGQEPPALPEGALRTAGLETRLDLTAGRVALDDLRLRVDEIAGNGRAAVSFGDPSALEGELAFGRLDLTPYLPPAPAGGENPSPSAPQPDAGWSDTPIELPLPLPVDVDFRVRAEGVRARQLEVGAVNARLRSDREQVVATVDELQAYGGRLAGIARAKPGDPPTYALDLRSEGVRLLAAMQALAGQGRFDGRADVQLALASSGASQRALVGSLGGDGKILLRDGAILGVNVAGMLRQVMTLGLNPAAGQQQRTDFAEAGGSFRVEDGVLRNDDLFLRAPVLRLDGAGTVDLPRRSVDYRVTPQLAATLEGQGAGGTPSLQAGVPFLVQGPLAAPSVRFDLDGALTSAVSSPADLARVAAELASDPQAVRTLRDRFDALGQLPAPAAGKVRDVIEGVLGGGGGRPEGGSPKSAPSLEGAARELLKGFGR